MCKASANNLTDIDFMNYRVKSYYCHCGGFTGAAAAQSPSKEQNECGQVRQVGLLITVVVSHIIGL